MIFPATKGEVRLSSGAFKEFLSIGAEDFFPFVCLLGLGPGNPEGFVKLEPYDGFYGRSIMIPPGLTHGVWIELFER